MSLAENKAYRLRENESYLQETLSKGILNNLESMPKLIKKKKKRKKKKRRPVRLEKRNGRKRMCKNESET